MQLTHHVSDHEELPRAYLVIKDDYKQNTSEQEIIKWMDGRVAKHKRLTGGAMFIDEVPKSPSGKIQRKIMREWAKRDAEELQKKRDSPKAKL